MKRAMRIVQAWSANRIQAHVEDIRTPRLARSFFRVEVVDVDESLLRDLHAACKEPVNMFIDVPMLEIVCEDRPEKRVQDVVVVMLGPRADFREERTHRLRVLLTVVNAVMHFGRM